MVIKVQTVMHSGHSNSNKWIIITNNIDKYIPYSHNYHISIPCSYLQSLLQW